jgi:uncharacterized protein (DUF2267 family)
VAAHDPNKTMLEFMDQVHHATRARSAVAAADAIGVVLSQLLLTVERAYARSFEAAMPPTLRTLLHAPLLDRGAGPEVFGQRELLDRIADHLRVDPDEAELTTRDVLAAALVWLPKRELQDLLQHLPRDLRDLFRLP